jgi:hypothetical protein
VTLSTVFVFWLIGCLQVLGAPLRPSLKVSEPRTRSQEPKLQGPQLQGPRHERLNRPLDLNKRRAPASKLEPLVEGVTEVGSGGARRILLRLPTAPNREVAGPNTLVLIPPGLSTGDPLSVVVFFHGFHGCLRVTPGNASGPCRSGRGARMAVPLHLEENFLASRVKAILVIPQLGFDNESSDPGRLGRRDGLSHFLESVFQSEMVRPIIGVQRSDHLHRLVLVSHSAGFSTVALLLQNQGSMIDEVYLLDAFYGANGAFSNWIRHAARTGRFTQASERPARFASLFRRDPPQFRTLQNSLSFAEGLRANAFGGLLPAEAIFVRRTPALLTIEEARARLIFARVPGEHPDVARQNFRALLVGSDLPR